MKTTTKQRLLTEAAIYVLGSGYVAEVFLDEFSSKLSIEATTKEEAEIEIKKIVANNDLIVDGKKYFKYIMFSIHNGKKAPVGVSPVEYCWDNYRKNFFGKIEKFVSGNYKIFEKTRSETISKFWEEVTDEKFLKKHEDIEAQFLEEME